MPLYRHGRWHGASLAATQHPAGSPALIVEAKDRASLSHGVQGLGIRLARRLNAFFGISGRFFRDRYHDRILRSPTEVRNALRYVLGNGLGPEGPVSKATTRLLNVGWRRLGLLRVAEAPRS